MARSASKATTDEVVSTIRLLPAQSWLLNRTSAIERGHDVAYLQGGMGSGKTFPGALAGLLLSMELGEVVEGLVGVVAAPSYKMLKRATLKTYMALIKKEFGLKPRRDYTYNKTEMILTLHVWGDAQIYFVSLDDETSVRSINAGWAHIDEASLLRGRNSLMEIISRVRQGSEVIRLWRVFVTSNPEARPGWLGEIFNASEKVQELTNELTGETGKVCFRKRIAATLENPHVPASMVAALKESMSPELYKIYVLGQDGVATEGLVVNRFSDANIRSLVYRPELPLHVSCDFNYDPCCWVLAQRVEGEYHQFGEICLENTDVYEMCDALLKRYPPDVVKNGIIINGDASSDNNNAGIRKDKNEPKDSKRSHYTIMKRVLWHEVDGYGKPNVRFQIRKANPSIASRVAAFNAMVCNENGETRYYIDPSCRRTLQSLRSLRYKEGSGEIDLPSHGDVKRDPSLKWQSDHPFDAISYLVEYYDPVKLASPTAKKVNYYPDNDYEV